MNAAIVALEKARAEIAWYAEGTEEQAIRIREINQAIRVLEAAGETDRETLLGNFDSLVASCHGGFTPGDEEFKPCFEGCVEGIRMIRALLEALPEEEE